MNLPWTKKYEPKVEADLVGQDEALKTVKDYVANYKGQKKKAILLYGAPGVGKTSLAIVIAKTSNLELVEINASDTRNKYQIEERIGAALKQRSLFYSGKIILIDEIDGLSGSGDRGGIQALVKILEKPAFPIIVTCTQPWDQKLSSLRNKSMLVELRPLSTEDTFCALKNICEKESVSFDEITLKTLARYCGGDLRAGITDLQTVSAENSEVTAQAVEELTERMMTDTMPQALLKILKSTDPAIALSAFNSVQEDIDQQFLWIDENLPLEYKKPEDLARAYHCISRADVFKGRIRRWQHWRFLVYISALLTAGVATAKTEKYSGFTKYKPTGRILKMWWANQKNMKRKAIAGIIATKTHSSSKECFKLVPYYQQMFKHNKSMAKAISLELDLDAEQVKWLCS